MSRQVEAAELLADAVELGEFDEDEQEGLRLGMGEGMLDFAVVTKIVPHSFTGICPACRRAH